MKTKDLINISWKLVLIYLFLKYALPELYGLHKTFITVLNTEDHSCITNEQSNAVMLYLFIMAGLIIWALFRIISFIVQTNKGYYDEWFDKHTDPKLEVIYQFFNRKNQNH